MQILKADCFKSITISHLLCACPNSVCIVYDDSCPRFMYDSIWIDSNEYSIKDLKEYIIDEFINTMNEMKDYLIIYTNKQEQELSDFIEFINRQGRFDFREILIACKY